MRTSLATLTFCSCWLSYLATFAGFVPSANKPPKAPRCSLDQVVLAAPSFYRALRQLSSVLVTLRAIFHFLWALATRLRVITPGHIPFRIWVIFICELSSNRTCTANDSPFALPWVPHRSLRKYVSVFPFAFASISAVLSYLRLVFRFPFWFPVLAAIHRLLHSGFSVFLYLPMAFLLVIYFISK